MVLEFVSELNLSNISTQNTDTQTQSYYESSNAAEQTFIFSFPHNNHLQIQYMAFRQKERQNRKAMTVQKSKVQTIHILIRL
ncbi:hypothetical protein KFK09_006586 [Dendrobium nobile]|uniref:Uncharacterized protein n=1 Tax=Dendrobium nobile TaxID=94219 RepID=A0A8T3BST9_DENNO|nr:hypothetical protein KFK09_006586 [Dendrobium nobile]